MKQTGRLIAGIFSIVVIVGSIAAAFNRQQILDYLALRNYEPSQRIAALATDTTMQDDTRRVFYTNHPRLDNKIDFRTNCQATEQSIVLGCYVQRSGIYLLDVTDPRLAGVIEVTAAHEVLHAHYDRLSSDERSRINKLTADFFATLDNDRVKKTVEQYRQKDAAIVPNEVHSILATEVRNLSPELEAYYARYFKDRSKLVSYSEKYEQVFVELTGQVERYDEQLKSLKINIESNQMEIEGLNNEIDSQKSRLDALTNSGRTEEYNASVPTFNAQVNSYNALISRTRNLINQYNEIVAQRNEIVTTEQELTEAINSNVLPQEAQ